MTYSVHNWQSSNVNNINIVDIQQYQVTPEAATFLKKFLLRSCIKTLGTV